MIDFTFSLSAKLRRSLCVSLLYRFLLKEKNDSQGGSKVGSQGGSLSARSFDLARPGLALPLARTVEKTVKTVVKTGKNSGVRISFQFTMFQYHSCIM